jgi:hypothetical protein
LVAIGPASAHATVLTSQPSSTASSAYTAMTPTRLLDTRATNQTMAADTTLNLPVVTTADGVPANATAVALNVTVTNTTDSGYLSAYPTGGTQPTVSSLNWTMGETVANSAIVPIGTGGSVTVYNHTGNTDVVVDIQGYFAPESGGSTAGAYVPLTPSRIDTGSTLGAGATTNVQVAGVGGVPSGATGAILNVTATSTTAAGYATVYPEGATRPTASSLNWPLGGTVANRVLASLSSTGQVTLYNYTGSADLIVDVAGYFTNGTATLPSNASLYTAITPTRLVDTRVSGGTLGAGSVDTEQIAGMGGISSAATAGVLNVTAVNTTAASFFTVFPGGTMPVASDVNWSGPGQIVSNLTVATLSSSGSVSVYNHAGSTDLVIDASGYFSPFVAPVISVPVPTVTNVSPSAGTTAGGTTVTVTGTNLTGATAVDFGATAGSVTVDSASSITVTSPAEGAAVVNVTVSTPGGTSATSSNDQYTYVAPLPAPTMSGAVVTTVDGNGVGQIVVSYSEAVSCSGGAAAEFSYQSDGTSATALAPTGCSATNSGTLTLTFAVPITYTSGTSNLVYTAPGTSSTNNAVYATNSVAVNTFAGSQTLAAASITYVAQPEMVSASVLTTSITITYNGPVSCSATGADADFGYYYESGIGLTAATPTGCSTSGSLLTLTGTFTDATGSASIVYTSPSSGSSTTSNSVYATDTTNVFAPTQTLSGPIT